MSQLELRLFERKEEPYFILAVAFKRSDKLKPSASPGSQMEENT